MKAFDSLLTSLRRPPISWKGIIWLLSRSRPSCASSPERSCQNGNPTWSRPAVLGLSGQGASRALRIWRLLRLLLGDTRSAQHCVACVRVCGAPYTLWTHWLRAWQCLNWSPAANGRVAWRNYSVFCVHIPCLPKRGNGSV